MATSLNSVEHSRLGVLRKGDYLGKYGRQGSMKSRFFILSKDGQRLEFKGRGQHRIPFKSVMLVAPGRESANFKSKDGDLHRTDPAKFRHLSSLSFSVHYYDVDGFSRSLDLQCIGNNEHKTTAEEQYSVWFNGLSMLVHVVRTYEHIPQAILSQDVVLSPSTLTGMNGNGTAVSVVSSSATHTSGGALGIPSPRHQSDHLMTQQVKIRGFPAEGDDGGSTSHTTHSTEADIAMQRSTQPVFTPGSSVSASESGAYSRRTTPFSATGPWPGPPAPARTSNTHDSTASQPETHVVFCCGHNSLGGVGTQPSGSLIKLQAFAHVDAQQVVMSSRSVACIDGAGQMYMAGTTADGEHFPTAAKLPCLQNQKVVQAACAPSAVFALADTGRVLAWGRCASGLLGMTSRVAVFSPKALRFLTSGPSPREVAVRYLAAGVHHCAAISDGSLLFTWGDGAYGRLGHGNMDSCFEPRVVSSLQQRRVSTVSCGAYHTAAVCLDMIPRGDGEGSQGRVSAGSNRSGGTLYTWGGAFDIQTTMGNATTSSNEGCLGLPMLQRHEGVVKPHPVELPNVVDVACGLNFTIALDVEGAVYQMGSMLREGEVPGCPWEGAPEPTHVKGDLVDAHVTHVSAGTSHVIVAASSLRDAHAGDQPPLMVLTWGANDKGQLARTIQAPSRRGADLSAAQMQPAQCVTPGQVVDMRGYPVSGIMASADSTAVVAAVPRAHALATSSSGRLGTRGSGPLSPSGAEVSQNPAMKLLRSVRTSTGNLGKAVMKDHSDSAPMHSAHSYSGNTHAQSASAGMVVLDSTMPSSTWVNPAMKAPPNAEGVRMDGPRIMHVGGAIAAAVVPGGMGPLSGPLPGIELPRQQQMPMPSPPPMALSPPAPQEHEHAHSNAVDVHKAELQAREPSAQDAPPPSMAYASTAEMMRRLNRGGPMRGIGAVPAAPKTEEKAGAINDRIAWLERVINDRNMEVSLAGAPEPDSETDLPSAERPDDHLQGALDELHRQRNMAGMHDPHGLPLHRNQLSDGHVLEHGHPAHIPAQPSTERNVQEWKAEMVAHAQMALMQQGNRGQSADPDDLHRALTSQESSPLYHMPNSLGDPQMGDTASHFAMHGDNSHMSGPAGDGYATDGSTGDMGAHASDMHGLSGVTEHDEEEGDVLDGRLAIEDLEQRHLILQQAGLPSISEQPDRNESDTSGTVTGNLGYTQEHDSRGGVAPPASTQAASHTAGTVGTGTDILSTASLPAGLTFLNAGTPQQTQTVTSNPPTSAPTNPHYNLTAGSAASGQTEPSGAPRSINNDPFSNVWQQLQQRPPSVQLLSLSSSVAGGVPANAGANARIHDNTSQMADLRLEVEKLRKELSDEKAAHKALQSRTLELRTRLSQGPHEATNKQNPVDTNTAGVTERFKSLVERNPVIVDSFWVPVDDGVSARLDVAEYTGLGKLKFSSRLFDDRAVKEWYKKNKHRVEIGSLVSGLAGQNASFASATHNSHSINGTGASEAGKSAVSEAPRSSDHSSRLRSDNSRRLSEPAVRRLSEQSDVAVA